MDTVKEVLSVVMSLVGLVTAIVPLYARYVDKKKKTAQEEKRLHRHRKALRHRVMVHATGPSEAVAIAPSPHETGSASHGFEDEAICEAEEVPEVLPAAIDPRQLERVRSLVKGPAIAMLVTGFLGLSFNLLIAGYGFIDTFVTPLDTGRQDPSRPYGTASSWAAYESTSSQRSSTEEQSKGTKILTMFTMLSLSFACVMAIWAGFNMIKLRSYWLSMAGCLAVMPGTIFCCAAGLPVGIWALVILLRPEVSSTFT